MTIIVFLLDTSASMNQRIYHGGKPSLFDMGRTAIEHFVKVRQRSMDSRGDRYMLLTFEEPPNNIKAGWKENLQTFMSELKNLQANGLTTLSQALRHTFDVLNVNRMQHGIDTYGQGRCPFYLEPCIIVCITDGAQLCTNSGVINEIKLSGTSPGVELTREPFRWDQRLFSLVLRMNGQPNLDREVGIVPSDPSPIDAWCEITGGRSYSITSHRMMLQCIDSLVQKIQAGVVLHFEKYGVDPPIIPEGIPPAISGGEPQEDLKWTSCHKMIYVPRQNPSKGYAGGFWPIPESFWPEANLPSLPPRLSHPNAKFVCNPHDPLVIENFPFDKYELEPSPLTQYILGRKQPNICWQVFVPNSGKSSSLGQPFGYLKSSTSLTCVNLFVMPYNYPMLLPLLDDLIRVFRMKPTNEWRAQFGMYLSTMPPYYAGPLKRALTRLGASNIALMVPEENYLSYSVLNYLKKLKTQAKIEFERTCNEVGMRVGKEFARRIHVYKNPFDIPRDQLLDHLSKLRSYFFRPVSSIVNAEALHNQPVAAMGNYQEYIKNQPKPLREIESAPTRQHMFGNPFKIDKKMIVDEAMDIDLLGGKSEGSGLTPPLPRSLRDGKRKMGPLGKDYLFVFKKFKMAEPSVPFSDTEGASDMDTDAELETPISSPMPPTPTSGADTSDSETENEAPPTNVPTPPVTPTPSPIKIKVEEQHALTPAPTKATPIVSLPSRASRRQDSYEVEMKEEEPTPSGFIVRVDEEATVTPAPAALPVDKIEKKPELADRVKMDNNDYEDSIAQILREEAAMASAGASGVRGRSAAHLLIGVPPTPVVVTAPLSSAAAASTNSIPVPIPAASAGVLTGTGPSTPAASNPVGVAVPAPENIEVVFKKNLEVRTELHKEIRRPRMRREYLLQQLSLVVGSVETRMKMVKGLEREALRFRRKGMAKLFEEHQQEILKVQPSR